MAKPKKARPAAAPAPVMHRKPEDELRTKTVRVLVTPDEHALLQAAATKERRTLSTWMRMVALEAATT